MRLTFLDLGIFGSDDPTVAIRNAVEYAQAIEYYGFDGIAVGEHYDRCVGWGSCVPVISIIAESTRRVHVSSAGALLLAYNPLSLISDFSLLSARHPNRITLGIARGRPSLVGNRRFLCGEDESDYELSFKEKLKLLFYLLRENRYPDHLSIIPSLRNSLSIELMGTGEASAAFAKLYDVPYVHSLFHQFASLNVPPGSRAVAVACLAEGESNQVERFFPGFIRAEVQRDATAIYQLLRSIADAHQVSDVLFLDCSYRSARLANLETFANAAATRMSKLQ